MSQTVASWLLDTGSLTERVQANVPAFSLQVVGEGKVPLHRNERQGLRGSPDHYQVREVLLKDGVTPWVFARSILPEALVNAEFKNLGTEPLGKRLFNDSRFVRGEFEVCRVSLPPLSTPEAPVLWGRRSCFSFQSYTMLVAEVFLPASPLY
ncbi:chorismate lyase [Aestuariibacter sp. A3R04]|nr:chorismate lyase [Aestuariibacter sp. A3R04]